MSKYRKIESKIWNDAKFNSLSDEAKLLFFFLLTHPHLTALGAMRASINGLADELKWGEKAFREAFQEVFDKGMLKRDEGTCFIWLPNFLKYNKPESPNVVKSWDRWLEYLPECELKNELIQSVKSFLEDLGQAYMKALPEAFRKPMPNHEHEHEINNCRVADATQPVCEYLNDLASCDDVITRIFSHWQRVMHHSKAKLDGKRKLKIKSALKLGFSEEELKLAIDGCAKSDFHMGKNDKRQRYDGLDLILRDAEHVEKFIEIAKTDENSLNVVPMFSKSSEIFAGAI